MTRSPWLNIRARAGDRSCGYKSGAFNRTRRHDPARSILIGNDSHPCLAGFGRLTMTSDQPTPALTRFKVALDFPSGRQGQ